MTIHADKLFFIITSAFLAFFIAGVFTGWLMFGGRK